MALLCVGFALDTKPALAMMVAMFFLFDDAFALRYISFPHSHPSRTITHSYSFLNVPWMYAPEINSLKMRTKGGAAAAASNWLCEQIPSNP
jgi:hypothetical protein